MTTQVKHTVNGVNVDELRHLIDEVAQDPAKGKMTFNAKTRWTGALSNETRIEWMAFGGQRYPKDYTVRVDEPVEIGGGGAASNPQDVLFSAFNACVLATYVANASLRGIELESLQIETQGDLDLRGLFALDPSVPPGYSDIHYTVRIKANATAEKLQEVHEAVNATSPNRWSISHPVRLHPELVVE